MKKFKKTLAVFTALLMALPLLWAMPTAVLADPTEDYAVLIPVGATPTAVKVTIGQYLNNCPVTAISSDFKITVDLDPCDGSSGHTNNQTWQLPYANTLWEGVGDVDHIMSVASAQDNLHEGGNVILRNFGNEIDYFFKATVSHEFWLKFDANGGTDAPNNMYFYTEDKYTSSHTFVIPNQIPTRTGYTFQGWSRTRNGDVSDQPGGNVLVSEYGNEGTTVTLYAVWQDNTSPTPTPTYTVTFHRNDGTNGSSEIFQEQYDVPYGTHLYKPDDPVWEGHTFVGWSRNSDGTNPWNFETDVVTGDTNLYAQWESNMPDKPTPEVVQHIKESSIVATECSRQGNNHPRYNTELYDNSFTIGDVEGNATDGYTCLITVNPEQYVAKYNQWFHQDYGTVDHVYDESAANVATFTMNWDAENSQWVYNGDTTGFIVHFFVICPETYTVTFAPGGGRPLEGQQHPEEPPKEANDTFNLPPCPYENPNHTFAGWSYDGRIYQPDEEFTMPANDVVFTATWEPIATSADILGTITVVNPRANKTYNAYRVFDLTYSCDVPGQPPTSYAYSIEHDSPWFTVVNDYANDTNHGLTLTPSAADPNHYIVEFTPGTFNPADFAAYLRDHRPDGAEVVAHRNAGATPTGSIKLTTDGDAPGQTPDGDNYHVPLGYYFVDTGTGTFCGLDSADPDAYIYDKYEVPGWDTQSGSTDLGKVVAAENPYATPNPGSWGKTSDETIGSKAWFKIMAHVPAYEYGHQIDQYTFTDTLGDGFTYDTGSLKIMLYCGLDTTTGEPIADPSTVLYDSTHTDVHGVTVTFNGNTFTVQLRLTGENAIDLDGADGEENYYPDAHIVIEYTAHVDQDAVHDNVNTAKMDWTWVDSNPVPNPPPVPTPDPDQPSPTPSPIPTEPAVPENVQTDTYVYGLPFNKTIKDSETVTYLPGAEFELYRDEACSQLISLVVDNELPTGAPTQPASGIQWTYYRVADATETAAAGFTSKTIEAGRAVIWGLAPGTYYLKETKAPDGYNPLAEPFPITISTEDDPNTAEVTETGNVDEHGYVIATTFNVENAAGAELPGVGGIGTKIFYIVGALLMIAAAVLLTVRKKMSVQE